MKIGIATCNEKKNLTVSDRLLATLLEERGFKTAPLVWNHPNVLNDGWDAIVLRSTWDYHQNSKEFLDWLTQIEQSSIKLINSLPVVRWNLDKSYLIEMETKEISIVPTLLIERQLSQTQALEKILKTGWKNIVLKPSISATSFLTYNLLASSKELPEVIGRIQNHSELIVQPFVSSIVRQGEVSFIFIQDQGIHYSHAVLKKPQKSDFRVQSDFGGTLEKFMPSQQLLAYANQCANAINKDWTFARIDIVDWEEKPLLGELELIEPDLFLGFGANAAEKLATAIINKL